MQKKLFILSNDGDKFFAFNRDCINRADFREEVERMWELYQPFCPDPHFESEFRKNFFARLWEIHLGCALLENGFKLVKPPRHGPDILVNSPSIWIEAVTATPGQGNNEVHEPLPGHVGSFAENEIILRLTSALSAKLRKIKKYIIDGIIKPKEPVVLAINSAEIAASYVTLDENIPMILKAVFPLGELVLHIPILTSQGEPFNRYEIKQIRTNANGAQVPTDNFLNPDYACVSALIFCATSVLNSRRPYGRNFHIIHNPLAAAPLELGSLPLGVEHWAEEVEGVLYLQKPRDWRHNP